MTFGWQRATLLGAFFNGVFLLALGVSIFLQSIERFVSVQRSYHNRCARIGPSDMMTAAVENPLLIIIIGCVGFALNVVSAVILGHGGSVAQMRGPQDRLTVTQTMVTAKAKTTPTQLMSIIRIRRTRYYSTRRQELPRISLTFLSKDSTAAPRPSPFDCRKLKEA